MTATERRLAELGNAADEAQEALAYRDDLIAVAARAGISHRAIARATGLTHPGVAKIVRRLTAKQETS